MEEPKRNIPLMIAFSIPIVMIMIIAVSIYLPALFIKPTGVFVYSIGNDYCSQHYAVRDEKITKRPLENGQNRSNCPNYSEARLFLHDVTTNKSREITWDETANLRVDDTLTSTDGFEVVSGSGGGDFIYSYRGSYDEKYLKKGAYSRKLDIKSRGYYDFRFIGWVKGGNNG